MSETVTIIRASNAFIYLPLYLAEKKRFFDQEQQSEDVFKEPVYSYVSRRAAVEGDYEALVEMREMARTGKPVLAVCDPLELFNVPQGAKDFTIVGALIKRPPFWVVNATPVDSIEQLKIRKLIYYSERLKTGNFLGRFVHSHKPRKDQTFADISEVGEELDFLIEQKKDAQPDDWSAISVDLLGLARARGKPKNDVNYCAPVYFLGERFEKFITTAFVTTKTIAEDHPQAIHILTRAIARAIKVINLNLHDTAQLCQEVSASFDFFRSQLLIQPDTGKPNPLNDEESRWAAWQIINRQFYSEELRIAPDEWKGAVNSNRWLDEMKAFVESKYNDVILESARMSSSSNDVDPNTKSLLGDCDEDRSPPQIADQRPGQLPLSPPKNKADPGPEKSSLTKRQVYRAAISIMFAALVFSGKQLPTFISCGVGASASRCVKMLEYFNGGLQIVGLGFLVTAFFILTSVAIDWERVRGSAGNKLFDYTMLQIVSHPWIFKAVVLVAGLVLSWYINQFWGVVSNIIAATVFAILIWPG